MSFISKDHFNMALKGVKRFLNQKADKSELDKVSSEVDQISKNIVQSDWNETNKTSKAYIQNKPFEESGLEYVFVDLKHAPTSAQGSATLSSTCEYELIPGNIYKVIINGVEKEVECILSPTRPEFKCLMLGPDSDWNNNAIFQGRDKSYISAFTRWNSGASVKVIGRTQPMIKLSEKYIPSTIARLSDVEYKTSEIFYGTCATASSASAKEVTVNGSSFVLRKGVMVCICFVNTNTTSYMTLNVNSTGANPISLSSSTPLTSNYWEPGSYVTVFYDGVYWRIISISPREATTNYYGVTKLSTSVTSTSTAVAATSSAVKEAYDKANGALPKMGGTMKGHIVLCADPAANMNPATKRYVDNAVSNAVDNIVIPEQEQSDWDQNDPTAKDYIKNRPFYDASSRVGSGSKIELYSTTWLTTNAHDDLGRTWTSTEFSLTENAVYCINWNGVEYDNIVCHKSDNGTLYICNDPSRGADYSKYPFMIYSEGSSYESVELRHDQNDGTNGDINPFIVWEYEGYEETINTHQLDEKFIPDSIARVDDIPDAVPVPATAKAGQTIMVESVDENGKPTSWKPIDMVIKNLDDVTTMKETNLQCGFYYRLSDPLPDGWYFYDDARHNNKLATLVVINEENTAVEGTCSLSYGSLLMYISRDETYIYITMFGLNGGVNVYGYNIEAKTADYWKEGTYHAARVDYFLNQKISSPEVAEVNQLLSVKAVDENGKPTEWEVVDRTHYDDGETIKQLDEKFIPDTIARKTDLDAYSHLPDVTTSDNGKILMVVDGVWKAVDVNLSVDANGVLDM